VFDCTCNAQNSLLSVDNVAVSESCWWKKRHCDVRSRKAVVLYLIHLIVRVMNTLTAANAASVEANIQQIDSCLHSDANE